MRVVFIVGLLVMTTSCVPSAGVGETSALGRSKKSPRSSQGYTVLRKRQIVFFSPREIGSRDIRWRISLFRRNTVFLVAWMGHVRATTTWAWVATKVVGPTFHQFRTLSSLGFRGFPAKLRI